MAENNRTDEMKQDPAMLSLQNELEAMARETPEMPESFRQAWREAVRKDAAAAATQAVQADTTESLSAVPADLTAQPKKQAAAAANPTAAPEANTDAAAEPSAAPAQQPAAAPRRPRFALWRAALNFAAIALFILGGSILGRESLTLLRTRPVTAALKVESAVQEVSAPMAGTALLAGSAPEAEAPPEADVSPRTEVSLRTEIPLPSALPSAVPETFSTARENVNETVRYESAAEMVEAEETADEAMPEPAAAGSADRGEAPVAAGGAVMNSMDFPAEDAAGLSENAVSFSEDAADADSDVEIGEALYGSSVSYMAADGAAIPKAAAVPEPETAEEAAEDTAAEKEAAPAALSALPEEAAEEVAEKTAGESPEESSEPSPEVIPEVSDPAAPGAPRTAIWLLGGILMGLAVFCWVFLLSTRKKAPKGSKRAR